MMFYALKNFFPSPLPSNYLLGYVKDIVRHMASLPTPNSFNNKRSYDHGVLNLINGETTKCLDQHLLCNLCYIWNFSLGLDLCYLVFLDNFVQVLVVVQSNYSSDLFPSSCQQTN